MLVLLGLRPLQRIPPTIGNIVGGVYWKPVYNLLEGHFELVVANARHIKAVPGHKTDVHDAQWIASLLQHGLLKASFVPSTEQRELRELTRYRTTLVEERARIVNRLQKTLEDTNLKLGDVVSDITGKSAQAILRGLLAGETNPKVLANLARGRLKAKRAELEAALVGTIKPHHRFMLTEQLTTLIGWIRPLGAWEPKLKLAWVPCLRLSRQAPSRRTRKDRHRIPKHSRRNRCRRKRPSRPPKSL